MKRSDKFDNALLKALIKSKGITQKQFAKEMGVSLNSVEMWVLGKNKPSNFNLDCIANYFYLPKGVFTGEVKYNPDVVEVIRCKGCKWYAPNNEGSWCGCTFNTMHPDDRPNDDDFCSYAER